MPPTADFQFSRVLVIESLEEHEVRTGKTIASFVQALDGVKELGMPVEYLQCTHAKAFIEIIRGVITNSQSTGNIPLLHVECHGSESNGLEFSNGSTMSWGELSALLVDLNRATRFNLVTVFSACYGGYFLKRLDTIEPAPCFALIAPSETVQAHEILAAFRMFYSTLFATRDAGRAVAAVSRLRIESGYWFGQLSELWFETVTMGYVENHCTKRAVHERARGMFRRGLAEGLKLGIGRMKRELLKSTRAELLGSHFDRYFMTESIPSNRARFSTVRSRMERKLAELRATGRFHI